MGNVGDEGRLEKAESESTPAREAPTRGPKAGEDGAGQGLPGQRGGQASTRGGEGENTQPQGGQLQLDRTPKWRQGQMAPVRHGSR